MMGNNRYYEELCETVRQAIWSVTGTNIIAGTVGGVAGVIVRMQGVDGRRGGGGGDAYRTTWSSLLTILRNESVFGLFKGMSSPLVGVAIVNAFLFGVDGVLLDVQQQDRTDSGDTSTPPSISQVFLAGAGSGAVNSLISCPTELAKIQLQNQTSRTKPIMRGPIDCLAWIYRTRGIRGWFRGMEATVLRETPSYGVYFATFEYLQRRPWMVAASSNDIKASVAKDANSADHHHNDNHHNHNSFGTDGVFTPESPGNMALGLMLAGGISGITGWISTYPIDVAKTRIQSDTCGASGGGTLACLRRAVRDEGAGVLVRGLGATVIRAFPTNAAIFLAYKWTMDRLEATRPNNNSNIKSL